MSITDSQRSRVFTVTMEELRLDDADTYWCGIERSGTDLGHQVRVLIGPGRNCCLLYAEAPGLTRAECRPYPLSAPTDEDEPKH